MNFAIKMPRQSIKRLHSSARVPQSVVGESRPEFRPDPEPEVADDLAVPGPSGTQGEVGNEVLPEMFIGPDDYARAADGKIIYARRREETDVGDDYFHETIGEWMDLNNDSSADEDQDGDKPTDFYNPLLEHDWAETYATIDGDLDPAQVRAMDEANDRQIRAIASSHDYYHFNWTKNLQTFTGTREVFTGTPGPTFPVIDETRPVDIFYKMFDTDFIDMLVTETNRYAEQKRTQQDPTKKYCRLFRWKPTDRDEMVTFLAILILQGLYPKVKESSYFNFDGYGTTFYFRTIITYDRFRLIKSLYHFVDNEQTTDRTKLRKIRPVIDYFNDKFSRLYKPRQEIAIDESLLKWAGRLSFSQRISSKAAQVGIKTYELCESSTGYLWKFSVYTGKDRTDSDEALEGRLQMTETQDSDRLDTDMVSDSPDEGTRGGDMSHIRAQGDDGSSSAVRPTNATAKIVYDLLKPLFHKGHTLIMDNFYNSPLLARCLKRDGQTDVYGTLRLSREFIPDSFRTLRKTDLRHGDVVATCTDDLMVMVWRDSNLVSMISTYHPLQIGTVERYDVTKYKPTVVLDYNKCMGGVDRKDQLLAGQPLERLRNRVWYKKLFTRIYNAALLNCFVIYTSGHTHKISHRQFRTILAEDLLKIHRRVDLTKLPKLLPQPATTTSTVTTSTVTSVVVRQQSHEYVEGNHFPTPTSSKSTRCWMCSQRKKTKRTPVKCLACNVNLCVFNCFQEFHKLPSRVSGHLPRVP